MYYNYGFCMFKCVFKYCIQFRAQLQNHHRHYRCVRALSFLLYSKRTLPPRRHRQLNDTKFMYSDCTPFLFFFFVSYSSAAHRRRIHVARSHINRKPVCRVSLRQFCAIHKTATENVSSSSIWFTDIMAVLRSVEFLLLIPYLLFVWSVSSACALVWAARKLVYLFCSATKCEPSDRERQQLNELPNLFVYEKNLERTTLNIKAKTPRISKKKKQKQNTGKIKLKKRIEEYTRSKQKPSNHQINVRPRHG